MKNRIDLKFADLKKRKKKDPPKPKKKKDEEIYECPICMEKIETLAKLDCCEHKFCFECIKKWGKECSNQCPICRKRFKSIVDNSGNFRIK